MEGIKTFFQRLHLTLFILAQLVMLGVPCLKLFTATQENARVKFLILAISALVLFIFNLVVELRAKKETKSERTFRKKFKKGAKIISNLASLVVLIILWQSSEDLKLLIPIMVSVAVAVLDSIYLFFGFIIYSIRNR